MPSASLEHRPGLTPRPQAARPIIGGDGSSQTCGWIVCQIGARENYAIARAMARRGALSALVTDAWVKPGSLLGHLPGSLAARCHPELLASHVEAATLATVMWEARDRISGVKGWSQILARNARFQQRAAQRLQQLARRHEGSRCAVFAYSYAAGDILRTAKALGWPAILGQIDPGPVEARLVTDIYEKADQGGEHETIPGRYWEMWHEETRLADAIVVNSAWSRDALVQEGISAEKIHVVPLAYEANGVPASKSYPSRFTADRPLRTLFLGQVTLRKGIGPIFEAMRQLPDAPIALDIVGPIQVSVPGWVREDRRITLHGAIPRSAVHEYYRNADLFLFPTLSDGFGLTQLEALSTGLPVIASRHCGEVVTHGHNGAVLEEVNAAAIAQIIATLLAEPHQLARWQRNAQLDDRFSIDAIGKALMEIAKEL